MLQHSNYFKTFYKGQIDTFNDQMSQNWKVTNILEHPQKNLFSLWSKYFSSHERITALNGRKLEKIYRKLSNISMQLKINQ